MTLQETPYYFTALIGLIFSAYATGMLTLRVLHVKILHNLLYQLLSSIIGILIIVSAVAVWRTDFQSVFLLIIPLVILLIYSLKDKKSNGISFFTKKSDYLFLLFIVLLLFTLRIIAFSQTKVDFLADNYSSDNLFYGRIAEFLMLSGVENTDNVYAIFEEEYKGIAPYHYLELWLSGIVARVSGLNTFYVYSLVIHTYFLFLLALANLILFRIFIPKVNSIILYAIITLLIFSSIIYFDFLLKFNGFFEIHHFIHGRHSANFFILKRAVAELFWITSFILIARRLVFSALLLLLIFAISFTTPIPGIFSSVVLIIFFGQSLIRDGLLPDKKWVILPFLLIGLFILIFVLFKPEYSSLSAYLKLDNYSISDYFTRLVRNSLHFPLVYFPFPMILVAVIWHKFHNIKTSNFILISTFLISCTLVSGVFFGSLLPAYDWVQFYDTNAYVLFKIVMTTFLLIAIVRLYNYKSPVYWLFAISFAYLGFRTLRAHQLDIQPRASITHSKEYLQRVSIILDSLSDNNQVVKVGVLNSKEYQEGLLKRGRININFETIADYLYHFCPNQAVINLSWVHVYDTKEKYSDETEARWRTSFFMNSIKKYPELIASDKNETLIRFIRKYKIHYLLLAKDAEIPVEVSAITQEIIVDSATGEQFVLLKPY
ncbi:hypothetical protein [Rhodoflexus sp.]